LQKFGGRFDEENKWFKARLEKLSSTIGFPKPVTDKK